MADTQKLRKMIRDFKFYSSPSNADGSGKCEIKDLNNMVDKLAKVLNAFVDEMEADAE